MLALFALALGDCAFDEDHNQVEPGKWYEYCCTVSGSSNATLKAYFYAANNDDYTVMAVAGDATQGSKCPGLQGGPPDGKHFDQDNFTGKGALQAPEEQYNTVATAGMCIAAATRTQVMSHALV